MVGGVLKQTRILMLAVGLLWAVSVIFVESTGDRAVAGIGLAERYAAVKAAKGFSGKKDTVSLEKAGYCFADCCMGCSPFEKAGVVSGRLE